MNWQRHVGAVALALCASGCATGLRRDGVAVGAKPPARPGAVAAPRQVHEPVRPDQPDLFQAAAAKPDRSRLTRYFPGYARPTVVKPAAVAPEEATVEETSLVASKAPEPTPKSAAAAKPASSPARFAWFGLRKPRGPVTYLTDARSPAAPRGGAVPAYLPVALRLPRPATDKALTTVSREVPADAKADDAQIKPPVGPDSSAADATPPPADQPLLAVPALDSLAPAVLSGPPAEAPPEPAQDPKPEPAPAEPKPYTSAPVEPARPAAEPDSPTAPAEAEKEATGRPRLPATPSTSYADPDAAPKAAQPETDRAVEAKPTAAPAPEAAKPAGTEPAPKAPRVVPNPAADPGDSLGLPKALLPATYVTHQSLAVRGSYQASQQQQPPPVLASPQVEPTPQAPIATTSAGEAKTWRRPCLRRLIRRTWHLGEFANPPTAPPH